MSKLTDSAISINTDCSLDNSINSSFVYNFYTENETVANDEKITNKFERNRYKSRFIRLKFDARLFNSNDLTEYGRKTLNTETNFVDTIYNLSLTDSLGKQQLSFFNKLDHLTPNRKSLTRTLDTSESAGQFDYYIKNNLEEPLTKDTFKIKARSSQRLSIKKENFNLSDLYSNTLFPDFDTSLDIQNYNNLIFSSSTPKDFKDTNYAFSQGNIFPKLKKIETIISEDFTTEEFASKNAVKCGFLVEKFIKKGSAYNLLCGKFFSIPKVEEGDALKNLPAVLEDEAIRYGQTYKYIVSQVLLYTYPDPTNRFVLNRYLICDHPVFSKDIICKEFKRPPPPRVVKFKYYKSRDELKINWNRPGEFQEDDKGYQILKRESLSEPFRVIAQLEGHGPNDLYEPSETVVDDLILKTPGEVKYSYVDKSYNPNKITIYAIRTIDAHGMFSNYSTQLGLLYDSFEDNLIIDIVSESGAKRNKPNEFVYENSLFFENKVNIVDNLPVLKNVKKISLYVTPDFVNIKNKQKVVSNLEEKYRFTIFKINELVQHKKEFSIKNFAIEET